MVIYKGCSIRYKSHLQNETCLSSTESEYTSISHTLRDIIPRMHLLQGMKQHGFLIDIIAPSIQSNAYEDNSEAMKIANSHKYRPRTKHLNCKLYYFRDYVSRG